MVKVILKFSFILILLLIPLVHGQVCESGETRPCGSDMGVCETGLRTCIGGKWSECIGEKKPTSNVDICGNGLDDNCDGQVDEGCEGVDEICQNGKHDLGEDGVDCGGRCPRRCFVFPWVETILVGIALLFLGLGLYYMERERGKRFVFSESLGKD